jgi:hypothetical protein
MITQRKTVLKPKLGEAIYDGRRGRSSFLHDEQWFVDRIGRYIFLVRMNSEDYLRMFEPRFIEDHRDAQDLYEKQSFWSQCWSDVPGCKKHYFEPTSDEALELIPEEIDRLLEPIQKRVEKLRAAQEMLLKHREKIGFNDDLQNPRCLCPCCDKDLSDH